MEKFEISAPGRIVLCGGEGATYGKHVVLASLHLRTILEFVELPAEEGKIIIEFPDIEPSNLNIPLEVINNFRSSEHFTTLISNHIRFSNRLRSFITLNGMWRTHEQSFSLQIFFFLLMHIARNEQLDIKPFRVKVTSELPINLNLGSSSSFAVCVSACFLYWSRLQRDTNYVYNEEDLNKISQYAKLAEKVIQRDVMETDVDVCCHGKIIKFKYETEKDEYSFDKIDAPLIRILLVDLNNESVKGDRRKHLARKNFYFPDNWAKYLNTLDNLSIKICKTLIKISNFHEERFQDKRNREFEKLKKRLVRYQSRLYELGLFGNKCEIIRANIETGKFVGMIAGYENNPAYILVLPTIKEEYIGTLREHLRKVEDLKLIDAAVSCSGVIINNSKDKC